MEFIEVEVINWGKHQRKDVKRPTWFALDNHILEDAKLFDLTDSEWKVLLYIFCQASQQMRCTPRIVVAHAHRVCGISKKTLNSTLTKLEHAGVTRTLRGRHADVTPQTDKQDKQDKQDNNAHADAFAVFWKGYPRKVDKKKAERAYLKLMAQGKDPAQIGLAMERYREYLKAQGTEERFIRHPTTFLNNYESYLAEDFGATEDFSSKPDSLDDLVLTTPGGAA